jgi:hypothetical protein
MSATYLSKALAFSFWTLRRTFSALYDDGYADWKALAVLGGSQVLTLFMGISLLSIVLGHRVLTVTKMSTFCLCVGVGLSVTALNYYALRYRDRWTRFEPQFERYPTLARVVGSIVVVVLVIANAIASLIAADTVSHLPR